MSELLNKAREYESQNVVKIPWEERPVFHFSVPTGWINDPNGFSDFRGEHHLFFQYYPYETAWNSMHWGHASSTDFVCWKYLPAALAPDETYDGAGVFSGSALEDGERQVLIYTGVEEYTEDNGEKKIRQNQCIAIGDGRDYIKSRENPVITAELLPAGSSREDFRDPKIWKEDGRYYVVAGSRNGDGSGQIVLFYSDDLKSWNFGSILDRSQNKLGRMWECPDFFPMGSKRVLMISPQEMQADGLLFHNGNNVAFLIGDYCKETLRFCRQEVQCVDYGLDFYAPQTMQSQDGRRIMIGWMQSWDNPIYPTEHLWSGMMTIPRELTMRNGRILQKPVRELEAYRKNEAAYSNVAVEKETILENVRGRSVDLELAVKGQEYGKFRIRLASDKKHYSEIIYDREDGILTFDRTHSGLTKDVLCSRSMRVDSPSHELRLRILLDRYSVEIFANEGENVMTSLIYTPQTAQDIIFSCSGKAYMDVKKYEIEVGK